jgi:hypothetical protein
MVLMTPLFPLLVRAIPSLFTTSARLGRAMVRVVQGRRQESSGINRIGI